VSVRKFFFDAGVGESRAVVTLAGRPERLIIARDGDPAVQVMGARVAARIRSVERALGLAFLDLGDGPDAVLNLAPEIGPVAEGGWIEVEIRSEARTGKGASVRWLGPTTGPLRLLAPGPGIEARLAGLAKGAPIETGAQARAAADQAQEEVFETVFPLRGGGSVAVEITRALTAVDVDLGGRAGEGAKRVMRVANIAALGEAARVLRLKGLGGLVVIDLAGRGHDGSALLVAAREAFAPDNPGVSFGAISRFGTLELTIPRRARGALDALTGDSGTPSDRTLAMQLLRALEREAAMDRGARLEALASPGIAQAAQLFLARLTQCFGDRLSLVADPTRTGFEVLRRC